MEMQMPKVNGYIATQKIRSYEAENQKTETPIIAFTAGIESEEIKHCFKLGVTDYLSKPIKKQDLLLCIKKHHQVTASPLISNEKVQGKKILLVDDEVEINLLLKNSLEEVGFQVLSVNNGQEALDLFDKIHFDLIISDYLMPILNGFELYEKVQNTKNPPAFIFTSGSTIELNKRLAENHLAQTQVFNKPFDIPLLTERVLKMFS